MATISAFPRHSVRKTINLSEIRFIEKYYPRKVVDQSRVHLFYTLMLNGEQFKPIKLVLDKEQGYYIALDGEHRIEARRALGEKTIEAEVYDFLPEWWLLKAMAFNFKSDKPLTDDEIKEGIKLAWEDKISEDDIARELGCTARYVYSVVKPLRDAHKREQKQQVAELRAKGLSQREIALRIGVSKSKVDRLSKPNGKSLKNAAPSCPDFEHTSKSGQEFGQDTPGADQPNNRGIDSPAERHQPPAPDSEDGRQAILLANQIHMRNQMFPQDNGDMTDEDVLFAFGLDKKGVESDLQSQSRTDSANHVVKRSEEKPSPSISKEQIDQQFPIYVNQIPGFDTFPLEAQHAARILEMVKSHAERQNDTEMPNVNIHMLQIAAGENSTFIKKIIMAAVLCTVSSEPSEKLEKYGLNRDLIKYIQALVMFKTHCAPIAPHIPKWIEKNFSDDEIHALANLLDVTKPSLFKILRGEVITNKIKTDPQKTIEYIQTATSILRKARDIGKVSDFDAQAIEAILKELNKTQIAINEIYINMGKSESHQS